MAFNGGTFLEVKDCIFIKGLPTKANLKISEVREFFQERIGECSVQMTALSKDKRWFFVALKFKSPTVAESVMDRFNGKYILGHRVTMSYLRVPRNMAHSGRLHQDSYKQHNRGSRWENRSHSEDKTELPARHKEEYSTERNSWHTKHSSSTSVHRNENEDFDDGPHNFRDFRDHNFPGSYNTNDDFDYQEENVEYFQEHWDSDFTEGQYYDDGWSGWDSEYDNGGSENLSEREYYDREEELPYRHEDDIWREGEVDQESDQAFIDETDARYIDRSYPELDRNRELYCEQYDDSVGEDSVSSQYDEYCERPAEETSYRTEDSKRVWNAEREYRNTQDSQARIQGDNESSFSSFDQTHHWPRWETIAPSKLTRRRLSDPDVRHDTSQHASQRQDLTDQRSCNKFRDLNSRNAGERPRSDEWLRNSHQSFQDRGRGHHSTSPVNLRHKGYSHQVSPLSEEVRKSSSETLDKKTFVDRSRSDESFHARRGRRSISPDRDKGPQSKRSSSSERSSDFKRYDTSPHRERSSHFCNNQSLAMRQRDSHGYSLRGRRCNRLLNEKGNAERPSSRRKGDLRRSLMLHQQRKHLSSFARGRSREEGLKCSSLEKGNKSSVDEPDKSSGSGTSSESPSPPKGRNRKRHQCEDQKSTQDTETTKKRKQTGHSALTHSDNASGNSESTRNKGTKPTVESRKRSPENQKKSTRERDQASEKSNTKRTDRLLNDLAATLAEGNIYLKRPCPDTDTCEEDCISSASQRQERSARGRSGKSQGYSTRSVGSRSIKKRVGQDDAVKQTTDGNLRLVNLVAGVPCAKEATDVWQRLGEASEEEITTPENRASQVAFPCFGDNSDDDVNKKTEYMEKTDLSAVNLSTSKHWLDIEKGAPSPEVNLEPPNPFREGHDFTDLNRNGSFMTDDFEKTIKMELDETALFKKSSDTEHVGQTEESKRGNERLEVVDMEFSSDDTSPDVIHSDVIHSSKVLCCPDDSGNTKKEIFEKAKEENNIKNTTSGVTQVEHKRSVVDYHSSSSDTSTDGIEDSQVGRDTLKQGTYNVETSEAMDTNISNRGSDLLYTETTIYSMEVGQASEDTLKQGSYNIVDRNCDKRAKLTVEAMKEEVFDAIYTDQELSKVNSVNSELVRFNRDQETNDDHNIPMQIVHELEDAVRDANSQEKILHTDKEVHTEVTEREFCHDNEHGDIYNPKCEESNQKDARLCVINKEEKVITAGVNNARQEFYKKEGTGINHVYGLKEEKHNTEQGVSGITVSDTHQEMYNDKVEGKSKTSEVHDGRSAGFDDSVNRQGIFGEKSINLMHNKGGTYDADNTREEDNSSENALSAVDSLNKEEHNAKKIYFDATGEEDGNQKVNNKEDVTLQEMETSKVVNPFGDAKKEGRGCTTDDNKSAVSSLSKCLADKIPHESDHLVPENLDHVDMEISSDEEHQERLIHSTVYHDGEASAGCSDACKPYLPSSPTWKSDKHCSPPLKDDSSPYSPSHPTNISEGDTAQNDLVTKLCYDDDEKDRDEGTRETRQQLSANALNNSALKKSEGGENERSTNVAASNQTISNERIDFTSVRSFKVSSPSKSKSGSFHFVSSAKDVIGVNVPVEHVQNGGDKNHNEYNRGDGSDVTSCLGDSTPNVGGKDSRKPLMKRPKRTQSLPSFASVVPKPKVVYVTATKTKRVSTDIGSQNKPQIFYASNDKTAQLVRSLSFNELPGMRLRFDDSSYDCTNRERQTVFESDQRNERKGVSNVLFPGESDSSEKKNTKESNDKEKDNVSVASNCARSDNMAVLSPIEGPGNFTVGGVTDSMPNTDKVPVLPSSACAVQEDLAVKTSGGLKNKEIATACGTPCVQVISGDNERQGISVLSNKQGTEVEEFEDLSTSVSIPIDVSETHPTALNNEDKATSNSGSGKKCNGAPSQKPIDTHTDEEISALGSFPENERLVSKTPMELRQNEPPHSYAAAKNQAQSQIMEVPCNCNLSTESTVEDVNSDEYGPVQIQVTTEMTNKRPLASSRLTTAYGEGQTPFIESDARTGTDNEDEGGKRNFEMVEESSCSAPERQVLRLSTMQTLPTLSSRFSNKRPHTDASREPPHPCKAARKPLKLIIPSNQVPSHAAKRTAKTGRKYVRKTSSCTITSADLKTVPGANSLQVNDSEDMLTDKSESDSVNDQVVTTLSSCNTMASVPLRTKKPRGKDMGKTSSCTVTSADLSSAPKSSDLAIRGNGTGTAEDMFVYNESGNDSDDIVTTSLHPSTMTDQEGNPGSKGTAKHGAGYSKKVSSCTVTRSDLDFVPGSNDLPVSVIDTQENISSDTCNETHSVNRELMNDLSSPSSRTNEGESIFLSQSDGWRSATGNTSPLSAHLSRHNHYNKPSLKSAENTSLQEHGAKGVLMAGKASFIGKESDWIAFKMERLRKKKEEIEQVYKRECATVINVVKLLVSKDPRLEGILQNSVRRSLQEMGQKCVQELEKEARPAM